MQTLPNARRLLRNVFDLAVLSTCPLFGLTGFLVLRSLDAPVGVALLAALACGVLGLSLWVILDRIRSFAAKLDLAVTDPFGLQYQKREWWEKSDRSEDRHSVSPDYVSYDVGDDWT